MVDLPNGTHNIVLLPNGLHDTTDPHNTSTRQDDSLVTNNITSPVNIMPQKPTCKVVKRQGQTGARIDPKGCKVRSENIFKYSYRIWRRGRKFGRWGSGLGQLLALHGGVSVTKEVAKIAIFLVVRC